MNHHCAISEVNVVVDHIVGIPADEPDPKPSHHLLNCCNLPLVQYPNVHIKIPMWGSDPTNPIRTAIPMI